MHPLQQQLEGLSQRARKLVLLGSASQMAAIVIAAMLLLGLVDFLLRPADQALRFVALAVVLGLAGWTFARYLRPAFSYRPPMVTMARKLERKFPQLGQQLSSAAAFLSAGDAAIPAGSPQLQRILIAETTSKIENLPVAEVFDLGPAKRSLLTLTTVAVIGAVLIAIDPVSASVAARRMMLPWSETPWPRRTHLELIEPPNSLARGEALEIAARDAGGRRVDDIEIQWRTDSAAFSWQSRPMSALDDRYVARLENLTESLEVRAIGGDDHTMPWHRIEIVDPPGLTELTAQVTPPAYTRQPKHNASPTLRLLAGSEVRLAGVADQPLQRVELIAPNATTSLAGELADDPTQFELPATEAWQPTESGEYIVRLYETGQQEVAAEFRYPVEVVADRVPTASFAHLPPSAAAATATIAMTINLSDDLRVASARLVVRRADADDSQPVSIPLFESSPPVPKSATGEEGNYLDSSWSERIGFQWQLAELDQSAFGPLNEGDALIFHLEAVDSLGQVGRGSERRLTVISLNELHRRVGRRLSEIEAKLVEALRVESEVAAGTKEIALQFERAGTAGAGDLDQLQSIELRQRQVEALLVSRPDSAIALVREALAEIEQNGLTQGATSERLEEYRATITQLGQEPLPTAARELIATLKQLRADLQLAERDDPAERISLGEASRAGLARSLAAAEENEREVVAALEKLLGSLARWSDFHRFAEELGDIRRRQEEILSETVELQPQTIGRDRRQLGSQLLAELDKLALRQRELARRFEQLQGQMAATAKELEATDSKTAARLTDVFDEASRRGVSGKLRDSSNHVDANRLAAASAADEEVIDDIDHLLDMLTGRRETDLEQVEADLGEEGAKIAELTNKAEEIEKEAEAAKGDQNKIDKLNQQRDELAKEIEKSRRKLERLEAKEAADDAGAAAESLGGGEGKPEDAQGLAKQAGEAKKQLRKAAEKIEQQRRQAEQDLFHEQIARLSQALTGFTERERAVLAEIERLESLRDPTGNLTPAQLASVAALAAEQTILAEETRSAADGLRQAAVFQLSLEGIARAMQRVVEQLEAEQTGDTAKRATEEAIERLVQLSAALEPEPPPPDDGNNNGGGGEQGDQPPKDNLPPVDGVKLMAEVKLLKLMQLEINRRTLQIEQLRGPDGSLTPDQTQELADLAAEQGHVADLFGKILKTLQGAAGEESQQEADDPPVAPDNTEQENTDDLEKELDELLEDLG